MDDVRPISESTAVAVAETALPPKRNVEAGGALTAIVPRDLDEAWRLTGSFIRAGMVPDGIKGRDDEETRAKVMLVVMRGMEVGLPPVMAVSTIFIVNNRPSIWGDGAVALIQKSGKLKSMSIVYEGEPGQDDRKCIVTMHRHGQDAPYRGEFSMGDAKRARLTGKGPWRDYPDRMLKWRAFSWAARDGFADCLAGLSIAEEAQDIPPAPPPVTDTGFLDAGMPALPAPTGAESQPDEHRRPKAEAAGSSPAGITTDPRGEGKAAAPEAPTGTAPKGAAADLLAWCPSPAKDEKDAAYKAGLIVAKLKPMDRDGRMEWLKRHGERYAEIVKRDPSQADGLKQFFEGGQ